MTSARCTSTQREAFAPIKERFGPDESHNEYDTSLIPSRTQSMSPDVPKVAFDHEAWHALAVSPSDDPRAKDLSSDEGKHQMKAPSKLRSKRSLRQKDPLDSLRKQVKAAGLVLSAGWHVKRIMRKNGRSAGMQDKLYMNGQGEHFRSIRQVLRHLEKASAQREPPERSITAAAEQASSSLDHLRKQVEAAGLVLGGGWHVKHKTRKYGLTAGLQDKLYINGEGETFRSIRQVLRHLEEPLAQQEPTERSITVAAERASSSAQPASRSTSPVSSAGGAASPAVQKQLCPLFKAADAEERPVEGSPERPGHASLLPLGQPSSAAETALVSKVGAAPAAGSEAVSCRAPASLVLYHRGKQLPTRSKGGRVVHVIEDMPVASQLSTLKVEVLDASHCPLLGRVPGRITAKYMGEYWEESSSTGHFRLPSLKVGTSVLTERHLVRFEGDSESEEPALLARLEIRKIPAAPAAWRLQLGASSGIQGGASVCSGEAFQLVIGAQDIHGNRCQIDSAKGEPRLSVQCNQAVELELGLHGLQKSGETGGFTINAVLTGQPGHVTVRVRDKFGPEGSSQLASASLDVTLCAAPTTAQGKNSNVVAESSTGLTCDTPSASTLPVMRAAALQQQTMQGLPDEEGAHQGRDSGPADVTAFDVRPGQKRKRAPAAELMGPSGDYQITKGTPGLPAAPATPPQPKSARMEQRSPSVSAMAHAEAGTHAAAALADAPAASAGAGAALAMQAALTKEQQCRADPSEEQQHRTDPSEGLWGPPEGVDAARAWQGQTRRPDAVLQEGSAVPDSACMALQKQIWALQEQLQLTDGALAQAKATAASQAREVDEKLAGYAAQLARVHTSCTAGRDAIAPCLPVSHQPDSNNSGADSDGSDSEGNDKEKDGLARLPLSPGPTKKKEHKASSEKVQKQQKRGKKSLWGGTMRACIPDFIPIGDDGRYIQASYVKTESRKRLWGQYREGLFLQVKVERPELIVNKALLFLRLNQVLSLWNSSPSALTERIADMANSPLQQAWIAGRLPANVKKNLDTKQGIHHTCARVAAQTRHTSAGEVSEVIDMCDDLL